MVTALLLLALIGQAEPCVEGGRAASRLLPVDEARAKPDFYTYRARLLAAIERRG